MEEDFPYFFFWLQTNRSWTLISRRGILEALSVNLIRINPMVTTRMLKSFDESIWKSLNVIFTFKSCLTQGIFPLECEKAGVLPVHKRNDNSVLQNTGMCPFSRFRSKFLNALISIPIKYFISRNLSGFKLVDSFVNQLLAITQETFSSFDDN